MGGPGLQVGSAYAELGARLDSSGFDKWERRYEEAERKSKRKLTTELDAKADTHQIDGYERRLKDVDRGHRDVVQSSGRVRTAFGSVWARGGAAFAAAGGMYAAVTAGKAFVGTSSDISESLSKNKVLFGDAAKGVDDFSQRSAKAFGISRQAALQYTGTFGNLFRALGTGQKESAKYSVELTKLGADMASFNNTSVEEALEAIRSGLVGETEPLRKFGVNMNDATLKTQALAMAKKGQIEMSKATAQVLDPETKAMAAMGLITKQTAAAHGDFERTSGGLANQLRILQARASDLGAQIGDKLQPIVLAGVKGINDLLSGGDAGLGGKGGGVIDKAKAGFGTFVDDNRKQLKSLADTGQSVWRSLTRYVSGIGKAFKDVFGGKSGITRDLRSIASGFLTVLAAVARFVGQLVAKLVKPVTQIMKGLMQTIRGIIRIIAGIFTGDFSKIWDGVKDIFSGAIKVLGGILRGAVTILRAAAGLIVKALQLAFRAGWNAIKAIFSAAVKGLWSVIKGAAGLLRDAGASLIRAVVSGVKAAPGALADAGSWVAGKIRSAIAGVWKAFFSVGSFLLNKIKDGFMAAIGGIASVGKSLVSNIKKGIGGAISIPFKLTGSGDPPPGSLSQGWRKIGTTKFAQALHKKYGLHMTSGYRSPAANRAAGGVPNSMHTHGSPSNPGAIDGVGPVNQMYAAAAEARRLGVPEVLVHDVGSGLHLHMGFFAEGGRVGPGSGGWRAFIAGEGSKDEWVISQEGNRRNNVSWAIEALQTLTGKQVGLFKGGKRARKKPPKPTLSKKNKGAVRSAARADKGLPKYEKDIQNLEREYDILDRQYGDGDSSDFITENEDGSVTIDETKRNAILDGFDKLSAKRQEIKAKIEAYRNAVQKAIAKYDEALKKLRAALKRAGKSKARAKERAGYKQTISDYSQRRKDLADVFTDLGYDIQDAQLDLGDLAEERQEIVDVKGKGPDPAGGGAGGETGTATPMQIAEAAAAQLASFNQSRAELFASFGSNFTRAGSAPFADESQRAAGMRYYGAFGASDNAGAGGGDKIINVTNHYDRGPEDPHTWTQQQRFELEAL